VRDSTQLETALHNLRRIPSVLKAQRVKITQQLNVESVPDSERR